MSRAAQRAIVALIALVLLTAALTAGATTSLHAPSGLSVVRVAARAVRVAWIDTNAGSAAYEIQESLDTPDHFKVVGTAHTGATSYTRKSAPAGRARYYRVRAFVVVSRKKQFSDFGSIVAIDAPPPTTSTSTWSTTSTSTTTVTATTTTTTTTIAPPPGTWQLAIRSPNYDYARSIAVDPRSGATYVGGTFSGTTNFGGSRNYTSSAAGDIFVVKYATDRSFQWAQIITSQQPSPNELGGIAVGPDGDVVVAGGFWGGVNIGGAAFSSRGGRDTFVADLAGADGAMRWARSYGATRWDTNALDDEATSVAIAPDGTVAIAGTFSGTLTLGAAGAPAVTSTSTGQSFDGFVGALDMNGNARWARHFDDASIDIANDVAFDSGGNLFVVGRSWSTIDFGLGPVTPPAGSYNDMYLAKFSEADGTTRWGKVFSGPQDDIASAVAIGPDANPVLVGTTYIAGKGANGAAFGQDAVTGLGGTNLVVAKFDSSSGRNIWARNFGGAASLSASDVAFDAHGNIVTVGGFYGTFDVGGGPLTSSTTHLLLFALSPTGSFVSQVRATGAMTNGIAVATAPTAGVEATGNFTGSVDFGAGPLSSVQAPTGAFPTNIFVFSAAS